MEQYERQNRIIEALRIRGMKQIELSEKTGISKASINSWSRQRWQPKQKPLMLMAQALDVSEMWLAGYDAPMERAPEQKKADALIELFNRLRSDEELKQLVYNIMDLDENNFQMIKSLVSQLAETKK